MNEGWPSLSTGPRGGPVGIEELTGFVNLLGVRLTDVSRLIELLHDLERLRLPRTVLHGDLTAANILVSGRTPKFIDWSESGVGNPIADAMYFMVANDHRLAQLGCTYDRLRSALLQPWSDRVGSDRLLVLFDEACGLLRNLFAKARQTQAPAAGKLGDILARRVPLVIALHGLLLGHARPDKG